MRQDIFHRGEPGHAEPDHGSPPTVNATIENSRTIFSVMIGHTLQKLTRVHKVAEVLEVYKSEELTVLLKCKSESM